MDESHSQLPSTGAEGAEQVTHHIACKCPGCHPSDGTQNSPVMAVMVSCVAYWGIFLAKLGSKISAVSMTLYDIATMKNRTNDKRQMVELLLNEVAENFVSKHPLEVSQSDCNQDPALVIRPC